MDNSIISNPIVINPVTQYALARAFDTAVDTVLSGAIRLCSRRRASLFLNTLLSELQVPEAERRDDQIRQLLDQIVQDEAKSEVLFDPYRRVALGRSKTIGPKVCALLTATLLVEQRQADEDEQCVLDASERMADEDLQAFREYVNSCQPITAERKVGRTRLAGGDLVRCIDRFDMDSNYDYDSMPLQAGDLRVWLGNWASIAAQCGLVSTSFDEKRFDYAEDSERHIDMPGTRVIRYEELIVRSSGVLLSTFIGRVM